MSDSQPRSQHRTDNPYAITVDELERQVRVPLDEQVTEQSVGHPLEDDSTWDEAQRQLRLAGGA